MSQINVYDDAHRLARALQATPEFVAFRLSAARLKGEPASLEMLRDFRRRQFELQAKALQGQDIAPEEEERFERLAEIIASHAVVASFLQAEYALSRLLGDIQKIIGDAIDVDLGVDEPASPKESEVPDEEA